MSEWWTYRPEDFLMFSAGTYWRLFELHNQAWWPAQVLMVLLGLALAVGLWRRHGGALRIGAVALALCLAFVAWTFLWQRYAEINWASVGFAWGFGAQTIGLIVLATRPSLVFETRPSRRAIGLGLVLWSVLAHPLSAPVLGRSWLQAEVIGLAPDPTAIATLGWLLCVGATSRATRVLLGVSRLGTVLWCAVSAATLGTMGSVQGWVMLGVVALTAAAVALNRSRW